MNDLIDILKLYPQLYFAYAFVVGAIFGSFMNVVVYRIPRMIEFKRVGSDITYNLAVPRSACPGCGHQITMLENTPVLGYLCLRGKCSSCKMRISLRYPVVEFLSGVYFFLIALLFGLSVLVIIFCFFGFLLASLLLIAYDKKKSNRN